MKRKHHYEGKWLLFVLTEERYWFMAAGKRRKMIKHYKHWCTLEKDTYGKAVLGVHLVKSKYYQDNV